MKKRILGLLCGAIYCITAMAQTSEAAEELQFSLMEASNYALENNRSLQNADLSVRQAYATRWQTIASMLPQADMSLGLQHTSGKMKLAMGGMPPTETDIRSTAGSMSISASIAINGQLIMGTLINNTAIEMQDINKRNTELDVISNVETYYITALAMERTVELLNKSLVDLERLHEITNNSVLVGAAEQTSADQIKVQMASMRSAVNSTKRSLEMIYNALALQLAVKADVKLVLTDKLDDIINIEEALKLLSADFDLNNNYNYQLATQNVKMAKQNVIMAGMAYIPTLSAFYQYTAPNKYFSGSSPMEQQVGVVGVQLAIPLWSSGKRAAGITEKKLARRAAENSLADARDGLLVQHKQLRYNLSSAYEDFDTQKLNIDVSQRVFENTSNKFRYGHASSLELTNASMTLLTAQNDYVQAILNLVNAQIELKKLLNK